MITNHKDPDKMTLEELLEEREMMLELLVQYREQFPFTCRSIEKDLLIVEHRIKLFQGEASDHPT